MKIRTIPTVVAYRVSDGQRVVLNATDSIDGRVYSLKKPSTSKPKA
jgi:hypothetical protein